MSDNQKEYIGDSVYAQFDGYHIVLTTENGYPDDPRNQIALEPAVIDRLQRYFKKIDDYKASFHQGEQS